MKDRRVRPAGVAGRAMGAVAREGHRKCTEWKWPGLPKDQLRKRDVRDKGYVEEG